MGRFLALLMIVGVTAVAAVVIGNPSTTPAARVVQMQAITAPVADVSDEVLNSAVLSSDGGRRRASIVVKACQDEVCLPDVMDVGSLRSAPRG